MASTPALFSYAQAAKGESMSRSQSEENRNANKSIAGIASNQEKGQVEEEIIPSKTSGTVKATENVKAEENTTKDEPILNGSHKEHTSDSINPVLIKDECSRATSPSASSNAATTKSIREEDVSATPPESESTWEKISQDSRTERNTEKTEVDGDDKSLSTFKANISPMKEAPVPAVNIWRKRLDDAQLKTALKPVSRPAQPEKSMPPPSANNSTIRRPVSKGFNATHQSESNGDKTQQRLSRMTPAASVPANVLPPPTSDATSWPMPGLARLEEKKTGNERSDQTEKTSTKAHGKEKWEKVDFVPTAVFNTPLPIRGGARGGRGHGRGGREGLTRGGSVSSPTPPAFHIANSSVEYQTTTNQSSDRTKPREPSLTRESTTSKAKRSSSAGTIGHGEAGSYKQMSNEKRENSLGQKAGNVQRSNDARMIPSATQADNVSTSEQSGLSETQKRSSFSHESNVESRLHRGEKRFQPRTRDAGPGINGYPSLRERGNRGSWRTKPGTHNFTNFGPSMHHQSSFANSKSFSEQRQNSHSATFSAVRESRQGRINTRSHSMSNSQPFGRFGTQNVGVNGLPMLQTDMANPAPYMQQPVAMSAIPFQPYVEHIQLPAMLQMQLEYYFSVDNLCKDIFLRKNMNSQGFVHLHVLANFNRIQILTTDELLLKWVCSRSPQLELRTCPDEFDYVRKAEEWGNWVLPLEDRDVTAQNDGPSQLFSPRFEALPAIFNGVEIPSYMPHSTPMSPATPFVVNGLHAEPNGQRGHFNQPRFISTTLSADVPDFKPARPSSDANPSFQNVTEFQPEFPDATLDSLKIFLRSTGSDPTAVQASEPIVATNGDINCPEDKEITRSAADTSGTDEHHTNGITQPSEGQTALGLDSEQLSIERSASKLSNGISPDKILNSKPGQERITWSSDPVDSEDGESYKVFRSRALIAREAMAIGHACPAMEDLYLFWSLFLVRNIHAKMYQDFHSTALADANTKQSLVGLKYLLGFYSNLLYNENVMPDRLLQDFVDLATVEYLHQHLPKERPALIQIRKVWNDEAMNSRNRLHLGKKIHEPLKSALDQVNQLP